jgi:hypothetical protein
LYIAIFPEQSDKISAARKIDMDECSLSDHSWITDRIIIGNAHFARRINTLVQLGDTVMLNKHLKCNAGITHVLNIADTVSNCEQQSNVKAQYARNRITYLGIGTIIRSFQQNNVQL